MARIAAVAFDIGGVLATDVQEELFPSPSCPTVAALRKALDRLLA